jgi:hypothetical protein
MASRTATDEYSLDQLRTLKAGGKLSQPIPDEVARELLRTPPASALRARQQGAAASSSNAGGAGGGSGNGSLLDSPTANFGNNARNGQLAPLATSPIKRAGTSNGNLPPSLTGSTCAQTLEFLIEEVTALQQTTQNNSKLSRDHMQRSLLQLFEDTLRDKFASPALDLSLRPGANQSASVMGYSATLASPAGAASRAMRTFTNKTAGGSAVPSLRPVDRSAMLGPGSRQRGGDALTDFVVPDAIRQQLASDINLVLDNELQRLTTMLLSDVNKVTAHVRSLGARMGTAEEELLHACVELDVSAQRLGGATERTQHLEGELAELRAHCDAKDSQMDLLREQIQRRNGNLDDTRVRFRKEVMRYKARIYELEMEAETLTGKSGVRRDARERRPQHIGNDAVPDEGLQNPEELTAAVENAVVHERERNDEELRKLRLEHAREKKALLMEHQARLSERDHEIISLRNRIRALGGGGGGSAALATSAANRAANPSAKYLVSGANNAKAPVSGGATPAAPGLEE